MKRRTRRPISKATVSRETVLAEADRMVEENRTRKPRRSTEASVVASRKGAARKAVQRRQQVDPPDDEPIIDRGAGKPAQALTVTTTLQSRHYAWLVAWAKQKGITVERELEYLVRQAYQQDATKAGARVGGGSGKRDEFNPAAGGWTK